MRRHPKPLGSRAPARTRVALLLLALAAAGCAHSPLATRTAAFATAATATTNHAQDAYQLVEAAVRDAEVSRMVEHFDTSGFDPSKLQPFLAEPDRQVRSDVLDGLRDYAVLLAAVSGDQPGAAIDTSSTAMATALTSLSASTLVSSHLTSSDATAAAAAINALGHELLERRRRRDLPSILHRMQEPIQTICTLLAADMGDPQRGGLRNQLHNSYTELIREQTNFLVENAGKLSPSEKRTEILSLPRLAASEAEGDRALASTQKALLELARTHAALAASAGQKDAPAFRLQLGALQESARRLTSLYSSLETHP